MRIDHSKEAHQCVGDSRYVGTKEGGAWPVGVMADPVGGHGSKEAKVCNDQSQHKADWSVEVTEQEHGRKEGGAWKQEGEEPGKPWRLAEVVRTGPSEQLGYIMMPVEGGDREGCGKEGGRERRRKIRGGEDGWDDQK